MVWILLGFVWLWAGATTVTALLLLERIGIILGTTTGSLTGKPKAILFVIFIFWPVSLPLWLYEEITSKK